jgi:selenide,water dikinase
MGGTPVIALNIMMFPGSKLPIEAYAEILKGGSDMASEAGVKIIGGHTIDDITPKYGLAVVGYINPRQIIANAGARTGDALILTKPIGTGVILAGQRLRIASEKDVDLAKKIMKFLNRSGAEVMKKFNVRGATDITGFGLAGHALKMAKASNVTININMKRVPLIGETYRLVDEGCIPGASFRNLDFAEPDTFFAPDLDYNLKMIAFDAQTSGGLLICSPSGYEDEILQELKNAGLADASVIGNVTEFGSNFLHLTNL